MASQCEKCENGTFLEKMNYFPNCFRCERCTKRRKFVTLSFSFHDFCTEIQMKYTVHILLSWFCVDVHSFFLWLLLWQMRWWFHHVHPKITPFVDVGLDTANRILIALHGSVCPWNANEMARKKTLFFFRNDGKVNLEHDQRTPLCPPPAWTNTSDKKSEARLSQNTWNLLSLYFQLVVL